MTLALHWFRTDLRISDNTALLAAAQQGQVVGLYLATPQQWQQHNDAPVKQDFWRRNLLELEQNLQALGIPLLFAEVADYAAVPALMARLVTDLAIHAVHCNREYPVNEQHRDAAVAAACAELQVPVHLHEDQVLVPPEQINNQSGAAFKVFTPWARVMRRELETGGVSTGGRPSPQTVPDLMVPDYCCAIDAISWATVSPALAGHWPAGEGEAGTRLLDFCQSGIQQYKDARDLPALNGTSTLSPYLAAGVVSVRDCWIRSQQFHDGIGVHTWHNELLWRDFYKHVMCRFPHVCCHRPWRSDVGHVPWRHDPAEFQRWCQGETGIPIIDAAMQQLLQTGWMHNRLRMITAMFLSKHLLIDWRWGERWFMQHLVDGDFAANNGGWQWSASTGTDAVPYFRIFNPVTQSQRFDADGAFIRSYLPALAELDNRSIHAPGLLAPPAYPAPMIELAFGRERALNAFKTGKAGY